MDKSHENRDASSGGGGASADNEISGVHGEWSTGLLECLSCGENWRSDLEICVVGTFAPCVLYGINCAGVFEDPHGSNIACAVCSCCSYVGCCGIALTMFVLLPSVLLASCSYMIGLCTALVMCIPRHALRERYNIKCLYVSFTGVVGTFAPCVLYGINCDGVFEDPHGSNIACAVCSCCSYVGCCGIALTLIVLLPPVLLASCAYIIGLCTSLVMSIPRHALRVRYNIKGVKFVPEPFYTLLLHELCHMCALCQEARELRRRGIELPLLTSPVLVPPPKQDMARES